MSELEDTLFKQLMLAGLERGAVSEYRFDTTRRWRFDIAYPQRMIGIEVEGGTWAGGRHTRGNGFERDCEKYNAAQLQGWKVYRFTGAMIHDGRALAFLMDALN